MKRLSESVLGRLFTVIATLAVCAASVHMGARLAWFMLMEDNGWSVRASCYDRSYYDSISCTGEKFYWWQMYRPDGGIEIFISHTLGLSIAVLVGLMGYGLYQLCRYIFHGARPYVDPCQDPRCPCARHEVEREEERIA